ncbi:SpoIIE family protein phosphatase [Lyngbya aestuarii]|uniref:SpoIIE family protein phosphatase n=1 Tax=Lyngbya aestuarii TaxID=118322 RepID=UPI00403D7E23
MSRGRARLTPVLPSIKKRRVSVTKAFISFSSNQADQVGSMLELSKNYVASDLSAEQTNTHLRKYSPLILIADDDRFIRMLLRQILQQDRYRVEEVENGEQCLSAYQHLQPDMVLLDAMMPVMDGFACCSKLQALTEGDFAPVLMITGLDDQASVDRAFEAGATDYVTKPIHPAVLRRRLRRILEASWAQKALRESEEKYRSVVENLQEVIFQTDIAGRLTFLNPAWREITGFSTEESLSRSFLEFIHPDDQQLQVTTFQPLIEGKKKDDHYQIRILTKSCGVGWIEVYACQRLASDNTLIGTNGTLNDITLRKHREQHLSAENATTHVLAESTSIEEATSKILQAIGENLEWDLGELWMVDQQTDVLCAVKTWHLPRPELIEFETYSRQISFFPGEGLHGFVWNNNQPSWVADIREDSNFRRSSLAVRFGLHSAFAFPVLGGNEQLGVICFFSRESKQLDVNLLKMMTTIGGQFGQFIKRKQAEKEVQRQNLLLQSELKQAATYVRSLLPSVLTGSISTQQQFIPSLQLGGDVFDYFWLDDDHLVIYLLDVAGHGVKSALLSVSVLNILRSQSLTNTNFYQPSTVLTALNQVFQMSENGDDYFTIWYGVYNRNERQLIYACAGHPPAILLSETFGTTSVQKLGAMSIPIGMLPEAEFEDNCCEIPSDSILYIFSDGVYEIYQPDGSIWGLNSLINLLTNHRKNNFIDLDDLCHQVQALNSKKPLDDDFSLLQVNLD